MARFCNIGCHTRMRRRFARTERHETILEHVDRLLEGTARAIHSGLVDSALWGRRLGRFAPAGLPGNWRADGQFMDHRFDVSNAPKLWGCFGIILGKRNARTRFWGWPMQIHADFQRFLILDGVVAGFAIFDGHSPLPEQYLLHPSDSRTGLHYRLIPMTRGILSNIFSADQAKTHLDLIKKHLLFADGARLMDQPTRYQGGRESVFRRSESAAFFGREIGLQYVHAHLRYAEALAARGQRRGAFACPGCREPDQGD